MAMVVMAGCGSSQLWYQPGHNQVDFDLDHQECLRSAQETARQSGITGQKMVLETLDVAYANCLFSRGWTHTPPGEDQTHAHQTAVPVPVDQNRITVFDRQFAVPLEFKLVSHQMGGFQDVKMQTLVFQKNEAVFLNMVIQETVSRKFDPIDYPVQPPFFVYDRGTAEKDGIPLNWTVFSGEFQKNWVAGIGAYYFVGEKKRVSIVLTKSISSQQQSPPKGLRLTRDQKTQVDAFVDQWLESRAAGFFSFDF